MRIYLSKPQGNTDIDLDKKDHILSYEYIDTQIPFNNLITDLNVSIGLEDIKPPEEPKENDESCLVKHAKRELHVIGMDKDSSDGPGAGMNKMMYDNIVELVQTFAKQGHSGFSANYCIAVVSKLLAYKPLAPLTDNDDEWNEVGTQNGKPLYQNNRCSHVFKEGENAYDLDGIVWKEENGDCYTNKHSCIPVTFPYTPKTEYKPASEDPSNKED